jgi:hypothetical protein
MLVVVTLVGGMVVPIVHVVHVIAVTHRVMAAARFVSVVVVGVRNVRKRVLVVVALVRRVGVAIMQVVGMSVMPDASMTATRTVLMRVLGMNCVRAGSHRSPVILVQGTQHLGILPTGEPGRLSGLAELARAAHRQPAPSTCQRPGQTPAKLPRKP